jgi:hypothetical protein
MMDADVTDLANLPSSFQSFGSFLMILDAKWYCSGSGGSRETFCKYVNSICSLI